MSQIEHEAQERKIPLLSWMNAKQIMNLRHRYKTLNEPLAFGCTRHAFVSKQTMFVMTVYTSATWCPKEAKTTAKMCVKSDTLLSLMQMMKLFKLHHAYLNPISSFTYDPMQSKFQKCLRIGQLENILKRFVLHKFLQIQESTANTPRT